MRRPRPPVRATSDEIEDAAIGRRRFVEVLDIEPRQPSAAEQSQRWDATFPTWLVSLALLGPLEWLIIAPVLGFLPLKDMQPDVLRGVVAAVALFFLYSSSVRDTDETPLRAAAALPLSPLRLSIDDDQLPVRVAQRYDENSVTAFAARGALGAVRDPVYFEGAFISRRWRTYCGRASHRRNDSPVVTQTYVVMSNLYAHGIAQPYARDAFVRFASAAALTPEDIYGDPERVLWPLIAAGLQGAVMFAPIIAAAFAAWCGYTVEQAILAPWAPTAPAEDDVEAACVRAEKHFRVSSTPERAPRRAAAFRAEADRWREFRRADERREYFRAAATAGSAAVAGTWLAPCSAQLAAFVIKNVREREVFWSEESK